MILADAEIDALLTKGRLVIEPTLYPIQPASVDLRLGYTLLIQERGLIDPMKGVMPPFYGERFKSYMLSPGSSVVAGTLEWVELPNDLVGIVTGKSSLARVFLQVEAAGYVDPGWKGQLTLELTNLGQSMIVLHPGMKIAQIRFEYMTGPAMHPYGSEGLGSHYQGSLGPVAARFSPAPCVGGRRTPMNLMERSPAECRFRRCKIAVSTHTARGPMVVFHQEPGKTGDPDTFPIPEKLSYDEDRDIWDQDVVPWLKALHEPVPVEKSTIMPLTPYGQALVSWEERKYAVGREMHEGWKRQKIANGFADHSLKAPLYMEGPDTTRCARCSRPPDQHHADMIPWEQLPPEQQAINYEAGKVGYLMGFQDGYLAAGKVDAERERALEAQQQAGITDPT